MKISAAIFLLIISFLTVQPLFSSLNRPVKKACCLKIKADCTAGKQAHDIPVRCDAGKCNPFMACASGNFYTTGKSFAEHSLLFKWTEKIHPQNDNRLAFCLFECWHPPENI
jgi:hypothetical protein